MTKYISVVNTSICVACGACENVCPMGAIKVWKGCYSVVDETHCIGCAQCAKICPANCITIKERTKS